MTFEILEGTIGVKLVKPEEFARALYDNNTRGYNYHEVNFYDDYISLSAPLGYGVHYTLVLTKSKLKEWYGERSTIREYYADFLEQDYIPLVEEKTFEKAIAYIKEQQDNDFRTLKYEDFRKW